ncbi:hypothetical protein MUP46_01360 [Patescibacteria group bacterium]|nr:hypothetical protein [Patescibacteria group bacterium]
MENRPDFGPRINYQAQGKEGGGGEYDPLRGEGREYFYVEPSFLATLNGLRALANLDKVRREASGPQKDKLIREAEELAARVEKEIPKNFEKLMGAQLNELQGMLDNQLLRFKSPYPYDSRRQEMWFDNLHEAVQKARQEEWPEKVPGASPEEDVRTKIDSWLDRIAIDATWGEANFRLLEGLGSVLPAFYDGKKMMQWVSVPLRSDPTASFYERTFAKELPGLKLTDTEKVVLKEKADGLREKAIRYQDDSAYWRMNVAAVQQIDLDDPANSTFMEKLTPAETYFIRKVFTDYDPDAERAQEEKLKDKIREKAKVYAEGLIQKIGDFKVEGGWAIYKGKTGDTPVPLNLLNWYAMGSVEEKKRTYLAIMETLLTGNTREELSKLEKEENGIKGFDQVGMDNLISTVKAKYIEKLGDWFSPSRKIEDKLAAVVARAGVVMDWGHMSSAEMSWGWNYSIDVRETKDIEKRKSEPWELHVKREKSLGGPTVATDISTPAYWRETERVNQNKAWSKGFLPPTSPDYRSELGDHAPDWKQGWIEVEKIVNQDPKLRTAWNKLWVPEGNFEWNPKTRKLLEKMAWYWETSIKDSKIMVKDENGIEKPLFLKIPFFFPPEIASLNFLNTISFKGDRDIKPKFVNVGAEPVERPGQQTVWDQLRTGEKMSELKWEKMGDQALYRWMITIGQTVRYVVTMLDPEMAAKDQLEVFFSSPDNLKELLKRSDLGERDEQLPMTALTISLVPLLVVLRTSYEHGMWGAAGIDKSRRSDWAMDIAKWITAFRYLPEKRDDIDAHYGEYMARMTKFYATVVARAGMLAGIAEEAMASDAYRKELSKEFAEVGANIEERIVLLKPILRR